MSGNDSIGRSLVAAFGLITLWFVEVTRRKQWMAVLAFVRTPWVLVTLAVLFTLVTVLLRALFGTWVWQLPILIFLLNFAFGIVVLTNLEHRQL